MINENPEVGETVNMGSPAILNDIYRRMVEEIQDYAIILMDKSGIICDWNRGAEKIKHYKEEEIIGKHFSIFYLQEDININLPHRLITEARETGRAAHEGWRKRKDGSRFWGSITITAIHDDENNVIGFCKLTRDLTDKKLAEDNLRISEEKYQRMVAEVQDYAIILLDSEGVIQNWNAGAEHIKGYKSGEVIGRKFEIFYTPEDRESGLPYKLLEHARSAGKALHEGWRVRKDGSRFWGTIVITALHGKDGQVIGFSKVTRDLTAQKLAEEKIKAYTTELEIQNSELEQFAYIASHDLQEPLRKIQTFVELIQNNIENREFISKYSQKIDLSAKRMVQLVRSLLEYSCFTTDKSKSSRQADVDLNELVDVVREDFELLIAEKKAKIIAEKLPVVKGNELQLGQLFSNLVSNSLKFTREDPVIQITARTVPVSELPELHFSPLYANYHEISFKDNGIGFEQQYNTLIFSLFQRLHNKHSYSGTGIGLALCKKIAEKHNGFITAHGKLDRGARFNVYLPVY